MPFNLDDLNPYALAAGLLFGSLGVWLFKQAMKKSSVPLFFISFTMIGYTYFINDPTLSWLIGAGLTWAAYKFWHT